MLKLHGNLVIGIEFFIKKNEAWLNQEFPPSKKTVVTSEQQSRTFERPVKNLQSLGVKGKQWRTLLIDSCVGRDYDSIERIVKPGIEFCDLVMPLFQQAMLLDRSIRTSFTQLPGR
ncbi:unnamed protein product [Acanthoscelides obtectus]|uniref:Uncharacterized protein n=1 Tax=Acanthoscelides obtectus TaxID=200917 RepID=A0A9P0M3R5_ACAOB|nr:unnamed protein product [Acanthoscelides obtectus]CAK1654629.1 hypothetical protein AOBTE_LOCUS18725 [Acanthoscelides obtectus]